MQKYYFDKIYKIRDHMEIHYTSGLPSINEHTHDYYEFSITLSPNINNIIDSHSHYMEENEGIFIYPQNRHAIYCSKNNDVKLLNISFRKDFFESCYEFLYGTSNVEIDQKIIKLSNKTLANFQSLYTSFSLMDSQSKQFHEKKTALEIILLFSLNEKQANSNYPTWLENVLMFFKDPSNYNSDHVFESVYKIAGYSKPQFNKLFKKYVNKTPIQYYNECKIEHSRMMLLESELPIEFISNFLGFSSAHFIHLFKEILNETPLQYRKKYAKGYV